MKIIYSQKNVVLILLGFVSLAISASLNAQTDPENPYPQMLFPKFAKSMLLMKNGDKRVATLNYNTVDEEMIFSQNNQYFTLDRPSDLDTIYLQNRKFVYVEKAFYEVIANGTVAMFIQHKNRYTSAGTPTAYGLTSKTNATVTISTARVGNQVRSLDVPDNVVISNGTTYWVRIKDGMHKFTSDRQFLKIFPDKETDLKTFMKKSKIDIKSREDLIKLGNYCNEIYK